MTRPVLPRPALTLFLILLSSVIFLARPVTGLAEEAPVWRYTVKPGDTLIAIAGRYLNRPEQWPRVQNSNRVEDPYRMRPGTVLRIPATMLRQSPGPARLEKLSGTVRWRSGEGEWQPASPGQLLGIGSALETSGEASALIVLADGSRMLIASSSLLKFDTLSLYADGLMADTRVRLERGQADVSVDPKAPGTRHLMIRTPSAQAVVRGTQFRVGADAEQTREETLSGQVTVGASGRQVLVSRGQGTVARAGETPIRPVPLLPAADLAGLPTRFEHLPLRFPLPSLPGARQWRGEIAADDSFSLILLEKSAGRDALSFADLPNGRYALRLRGIDDRGLQGIDALHSFVVFARPFPPGLNSPGDSATIRSATPRFAWGSVLDVARYRIQVSTVPDFSTVLHDVTLSESTWETPQELPAGRLYWRAHSLLPDGSSGPWSRPAAFDYKPGPGPVDLGRSALQVERDRLEMTLPAPPPGLFYEAVLSADRAMSPALVTVRSDDGRLLLPWEGSGSYFLGLRLVDRSDGTAGPFAVQRIDMPPSRLWMLLLLLPLML